jgi:hypothetical protein
VRFVRVYRAVDGGPARRVATTARPSQRGHLRRGATNEFFTVARDRAGNTEPAPAGGRPDARTRVR